MYIVKESCLSLCLYVTCAFVCKTGSPGKASHRQLNLLVHPESMQLDTEIVVVFRTSIGTTQFLPIKPTLTLARISLERRIGSPSNLNCLFLTLEGTRGLCQLLQVTSKKARYFLVYLGL